MTTALMKRPPTALVRYEGLFHFWTPPSRPWRPGYMRRMASLLILQRQAELQFERIFGMTWAQGQELLRTLQTHTPSPAGSAAPARR
jgi:hypothetical protein